MQLLQKLIAELAALIRVPLAPNLLRPTPARPKCSGHQPFLFDTITSITLSLVMLSLKASV